MYTEREKKLFDKIVKQLNKNAEKRKVQNESHVLKSTPNGTKE